MQPRSNASLRHCCNALLQRRSLAATRRSNAAMLRRSDALLHCIIAASQRCGIASCSAAPHRCCAAAAGCSSAVQHRGLLQFAEMKASNTGEPQVSKDHSWLVGLPHERCVVNFISGPCVLRGRRALMLPTATTVSFLPQQPVCLLPCRRGRSLPLQLVG
jgi:hypothetical protein